MTLLEALDRAEQCETRQLACAHELDDAPRSHVRLRFEAGQVLGHLQLGQQVSDPRETLLDDGMSLDQPAILLLTQSYGLARPVGDHVGHADATLMADTPLAKSVGLDEPRDHV